MRLSIMHVCDAAFRANRQVVVVSRCSNAGKRFKCRAKDTRSDRTVAASLGCAAPSVGRWALRKSACSTREANRAGDLGWRSGVRLSAKFPSGLMEEAVQLNRHVVRELSATPAALDAYACISLALCGATVGQILTTPWDDLLQRFGTTSQGAAEFRSASEVTLRRLFGVEGSAGLAVDDEGISVHRVGRAHDGIAAVGTTLIQRGADLLGPVVA
jgi:hypothetical protein